jgi:glucan phosphorylase
LNKTKGCLIANFATVPFIFGNTAAEVEALRSNGYQPRDYYDQDQELRQALTQMGTGVFSPQSRAAIAVCWIR